VAPELLDEQIIDAYLSFSSVILFPAGQYARNGAEEVTKYGSLLCVHQGKAAPLNAKDPESLNGTSIDRFKTVKFS
jgi:hypothetical protein